MTLEGVIYDFEKSRDNEKSGTLSGAGQQTMGPLGDVPFGAPVTVFSVVTIETTKRSSATDTVPSRNGCGYECAVRPHGGPWKILKIHNLRHPECLIWHAILTFSPVAFV